MVDVGQVLVIGVGVDGGHQAVFNAELTVQDLRHRCQAVGGAGSIGNNVMGLAQNVVVDTVDHCRIGIFAGSGDNHLARASSNMCLSLAAFSEQTCAFKHHIDVQCRPRQFGRIANRGHADAVAIDGQAFLIVFDIGVERAVNRVVLEQMGIDRTVTQIVDGDDLQVLTVALGIQCAQDVTADTAKTIDCDS